MSRHVFVRVAIVDHQRLARPLGDLDVRAEPVPLQPWRRALPVVVQPGLADRTNLRQPREPRDLVQCRIAGGLGSAVSFGWIATAAYTSACSAAQAAAHWTTRHRSRQ